MLEEKRNLKIHIIKWPSSQLKEKCTYYLDTKGKKLWHGIFENWHENGKKESETRWKDGKRHGTFIIWRNDGSVSSIGEFKNGEADGMFKSWNKMSRLSYEKILVKGVISEGEFYSPTGELVSRVKNGTGKDICYHDSGKQVSEIIWESGKEKETTWWYDNGQMASQEIYDEKGLLQSGIYLDPEGKNISEVINGNGKAILTSLELDPDTNIDSWYKEECREVEYRNGIRIGEWDDFKWWR